MDLKNLFLSEASFKEHHESLKLRRAEYISLLLLLLKKKIDITTGSKSRILAAAFSLNDRELSDYLLHSLGDEFGVAEILKALNLLDSPRRIRQLENQLAKLEREGCRKKKKLGQIKSTINDLKREEVVGSVSGALAKYIRRWAGTIPKERLEYFALNMPKDTWKKLADIVHFAPTDFTVPWFLPFLYGGAKDSEAAPAAETEEVPMDSTPTEEETKERYLASHGTSSGEDAASIAEAFANAETMSEDDLITAAVNFKAPYSFLRRNLKARFTPRFLEAVAGYTDLETIIWWYEEFSNNNEAAISKIVQTRLEAGEEPIGPRANYGMLVERLMTFKRKGLSWVDYLMPIAEKRLHTLTLSLESPVAVFGDSSSSMDVAIRTANIFAAMLTVLSNAELSFFSGKLVPAPLQPRSVADTLSLTESVRASGSTSPAACLWPYYEEKKKVKTFFVVTDEEENTSCNGFRFAPLFEKYRNEVYPAKIVFISFLRPAAPGEMVTELQAKDIPYLQFRMDSSRPDQTKLDSLLALISTESQTFSDEIRDLAALLTSEGIKAVLARLEATA